MAEAVLRVKNVSKQYHKAFALHDVSFSLEKGEICGLIGQNGAGKSTLMRLITGLSFANEGNIELLGASKGRDLLPKRKQTGSMIEGPQIIPSMSAFDNLKFYRKLRGLPQQGQENDLLKMVNLSHTGKKKAKDFSLGMKQRLGIAIALLGNPRLLILDEPINGLDPMGVVEVRNLLRDLQHKGMTILISSHNLPELHQIATDYLIINQGSLIKHLSAEELEEECQEYIMLESPERENLIAALKECFASLSYEKVSDYKVKLYGALDKRKELAYLFLSRNIPLTEFAVQENTLEQYYLSLIGGAHHA